MLFLAYSNGVEINNFIKQITRSAEQSIPCQEIVPEQIKNIGGFGIDRYYDYTSNKWKDDWSYDATHFNPPLTSLFVRCYAGKSIGENVNHIYCKELNAVKHTREMDESGILKKDQWEWYKIDLELNDTGQKYFDKEIMSFVYIYDVINSTCHKAKVEVLEQK